MEVGIDVNLEGFQKFGEGIKEVNKKLAKLAAQFKMCMNREIPSVKKCHGIYKRIKKARTRKKQLSRANRELEKWYRKGK